MSCAVGTVEVGCGIFGGVSALMKFTIGNSASNYGYSGGAYGALAPDVTYNTILFGVVLDVINRATVSFTSGKLYDAASINLLFYDLSGVLEISANVPWSSSQSKYRSGTNKSALRNWMIANLGDTFILEITHNGTLSVQPETQAAVGVYSAKSLLPADETVQAGSTEIECGIVTAVIESGVLSVETGAVFAGFTGFDNVFGGGDMGAWDTDPLWTDFTLERLIVEDGDQLEIRFVWPGTDPAGEGNNMLIRFPDFSATWFDVPPDDGNYILNGQTALRAYFVAEVGNDIPVDLVYQL